MVPALMIALLLQQKPLPPVRTTSVEMRLTDPIGVNGPAGIPIVWRHEGRARAIYDSTEKWLILMVDRVGADPPDGLVDRTITLQEVDRWPLGEKCSGQGAIEEYTLFADRRSAVGVGLRTDSGLFLALPAGTYRRGELDVFRKWEAKATVSYRGMTEPVRIGGDVLPPKKIVDVAPEMPPMKPTNPVVTLEIVISNDGAVLGARAINGDFLLFEAALTAVRQWRYQVTEINGLRVPVSMTVTVKFQ